MIQRLEEISALLKSGHIQLGMTRQALEPLLGRPDEVGGVSRKYQIPSIIKYGDVQFVFPRARTESEIEGQGLLYVFVDDSVKDVSEPLFLLQSSP
jgi:hypothetical protein